ncbi:hypothetical protein T01_11047 [Trichinella spiralis]|uniref:Uncharacterized protein n=1 Tax=Trichinella spiralis TaxID=6334 RepID=A0A0V1B6Y2_TRISP|nr:hypothetical protein T01_11047 [Trichinella spiralis]
MLEVYEHELLPLFNNGNPNTSTTVRTSLPLDRPSVCTSTRFVQTLPTRLFPILPTITADTSSLVLLTPSHRPTLPPVPLPVRPRLPTFPR